MSDSCGRCHGGWRKFCTDSRPQAIVISVSGIVSGGARFLASTVYNPRPSPSLNPPVIPYITPPFKVGLAVYPSPEEPGGVPVPSLLVNGKVGMASNAL